MNQAQQITEQFVPIHEGQGDCYEVAGNLMFDMAIQREEHPKFNIRKLVHAKVVGQGPIVGLEYGHAWIEEGDTVIDQSNGRDIKIPKAAYYALGQIQDKPGKLYRYDFKGFQKWVNKTGHYGPWELKTESGL